MEACYTPTGGGSLTCNTDASAPTLTVNPLDAGNTDATTNTPAGPVDILTGNLALSATDAGLSGPGSDLSLSRTFNTLDWSRTTDPASGKASVFGPGWSTALSVDSASSDWTGLSDRGSTVAVVDSDGAATTFAKTSGGAYTPTGDDADSGLTLTAGAAVTNGVASWTVKDLDGNATTFTPVASSFGSVASPTAAHAYQVGTVTQPGSNQTSTYTYDASGYPQEMLAPTPAGSTCTTWVAGCRALDFGYNGSHQLTSVTFKTTDAAGTSLSVIVACYSYAAGRLASTWDPRDATSGGAGVTCTTPGPGYQLGYDSSGQLTSITPPGLAAEVVSYDATNRVTTISRTHDAAHGSGTETTTVVYGVSASPDPAHPEYRPDLTTATIAGWGQTEAPATAAAVFGPGHTASGTDLRGASVTYLNADGRALNTADYAGTGADGWNIDTTTYDDHGNVTSTLTAGNRAEALNQATADPDLGLPADTAAAAAALSTVNLYQYDTAGVGDLTDTFGPAHLTAIPGQADPVPARTHTHTDYDTGAETGHPAGGVLHLPVKTTTGASTSLQPVPASTDADQRVTTTAYALSASDATGWTFRSPMKVTTDPAGLNISSITRYDATTGATIETRQPKSAGGDAATTNTVYWTAGSISATSATVCQRLFRTLSDMSRSSRQWRCRMVVHRRCAWCDERLGQVQLARHRRRSMTAFITWLPAMCGGTVASDHRKRGSPSSSRTSAAIRVASGAVIPACSRLPDDGGAVGLVLAEGLAGPAAGNQDTPAADAEVLAVVRPRRASSGRQSRPGVLRLGSVTQPVGALG